MSWKFSHCSCKDIHHSQILTLRFVGIFLLFLIPETKRKTLEELAGEVPGTENYDPEMAGDVKPLEEETTVYGRENPIPDEITTASGK